jgi:hypothetical protein
VVGGWNQKGWRKEIKRWTVWSEGKAGSARRRGGKVPRMDLSMSSAKERRCKSGDEDFPRIKNKKQHDMSSVL